MDNIMVAISAFLLVILLKDIIILNIYMHLRFCATLDRITDVSQARIFLLDNSYLLR